MGNGCGIKPLFNDEYINSHSMEKLLNGVGYDGTLIRALKEDTNYFNINSKEYESNSAVYDKQIRQIWNYKSANIYDDGNVVITTKTSFGKQYPTFESYRDYVLSKLYKGDNK